jgi:hypothetical protein
MNVAKRPGPGGPGYSTNRHLPDLLGGFAIGLAPPRHLNQNVDLLAQTCADD